MKYAVIQTGGKQYRVSEGDIIEVEHLTADKDQKVTFAEVLLFAHDGAAKVGTPFVEGISVAAVVVDHVKGDKIRVAKFKAKSRYRRVTGHRQSLTKIKIDTIHDGKPTSVRSAQGKKDEEKASPKAQAAKSA